ncbi:hypothetical protein E3T40_15280 [Cryobacterium sp. TMT1-19]|uniref:hypothetical protein n=1 Tax=Cryobacterium sp. M25 TaxID=2048293 RepID=UPI001069CC42|nr:hypothetical protein [Cryobacterium sp. M25]TFD30357.1 hypothetical protein E3T40_15280 [Cryobacterium sp. TMT1-19]
MECARTDALTGHPRLPGAARTGSLTAAKERPWPLQERASAPRQSRRREGRRALTTSWISVAFLPVFLVDAALLGDALLSCRVTSAAARNRSRWGQQHWPASRAVLVLLAPSIEAMVFGFRARRLGA